MSMKKIYACINLDDKERMNSSSGGVYPLLAKHIVQDGGIVYAVVYNQSFETEHVRIQDIDSIAKSCGSKYIPSKLGTCFKSIKLDLESGKNVLFVGTPCQCAGLNSFLNKKYTGLYCIDFVCHGVPSKKAWRKYIEQYNNFLSEINMRDKTLGWSNYNYNWKFKYLDHEKIINQNDVTFMRGFVADLYLRPSCYNCQFKGIDRLTDLTLGDLWGVWNEYPNLDDNKGISLVIPHTDKGMKLLNLIKPNINMTQVEGNKILKYNPSIFKSASKNKKRDLFFRYLDSDMSFDEIITKINHPSKLERIKQLLNI